MTTVRWQIVCSPVYVLLWFAIPISWKELLKRTVRETVADNGLGLAAQLAYYFFLALFPALLFLIAIASYFPIENVLDELLSTLARFAPGDVLRIVRDQIVKLSRGEHGGVLTIGFLGVVWTSSAALVAVIDALNRAYDIDESRPWWRVRITAVLLTIGLAVFIVVSFALVLGGPRLAEVIAAWFGLGEAFEWTWKIVQWPVVFALVSVGVGLVYYFAPDAEQIWVWISPGSAAATLLWLLGSLGFKLYIANFGSYNETYGAIGGVMVLLLWLYMSGLAILVGAELNAEIEHASPHRQMAGEEVAGRKKKIGVAAERASRRQAVAHGPSAPSPHRAPTPRLRPSEVALGFGALVAQMIAALRRRRSRQM